MLQTAQNLIQRLDDAWTFRPTPAYIDVYYHGAYMIRLYEEPDYERLLECSKFFKENVRTDIRVALCVAYMTRKELDSLWFGAQKLNTYERIAALSLAGPDVIAEVIASSLKQVPKCDVEPTTYEQVLIHVLAPRAAELLREPRRSN